jgi:hypothetical protein
MGRQEFSGVLDMDNPALKRRLLSWLGALSGFYDVRVLPKRPVRSLKQNSFWHAAIVEPFAQFLREQEFSLSSHDDAHALLKEKFLRVPVTDPNGEVVGYVTRSTTGLTVEEFSQLCDVASEWLEQQFGIITMSVDLAGVGR